MTRLPLDPGELAERLERFPQVALGTFPTPLEQWDRLRSRLVGLTGRLYAKREDLSGLAFGGNKVRQLEFLLGDAVAQGADTIVHGGAIQSNYCRMLSAAAARLGLECRLVLSRAYDQPEDQANILLDWVAGAIIEFVEVPLGEQHEAIKRDLSERLRGQGRHPYLITYPRSEILGTLSYVKAALELHRQCSLLPELPGTLVTAAVGSTQAGLLLGSRLLGWPLRVLGVAPLSREYAVTRTLAHSIAAAADLLQLPMPVQPNEILSDIDFVGEGYARPSQQGLEAICTVARAEGVFLDPVYTSKAMAALCAYAERGVLVSDEDVIFVHTGGNVALFAYQREMLAALRRGEPLTAPPPAPSR